MKFKEFLNTSKGKLVAVSTGAMILASNAMAKIEMDSTTGIVTGELDKGPFFSIAAVVVVAIGAFWAVRKGIGLLSR
ncbi:MAG: hypothetical protein SPI03_07195 [Campylobacter sputorum]|uniref:hypothetical protein n=1 Tax=Campylobacter sputorum TaxID=206 RepID=UPI000B77E78E|nr:hypothetical protein [Campylobacter sputorum]ASM38859.1 hypothetical protein CSPARA_1312 [Campylobacter sputorum bv. paraureolyticus LMG 11764]MDY6121098.1 hypothetical protein [Campylobacter sputorum]